ncbi:MAG: homoserine O-succinyltransferase [Polyangiaceae bacterium]
MTLLLSSEYADSQGLGGLGMRWGTHVRNRHSVPLRIGIINIMPRAEVYEINLLRPLERAPQVVAPVWIRLRDHRYRSSDGGHLDAHYVRFEDALREPLDGLILTGAPIEQLEYGEVTYWRELVSILEFARENIAGTLGLCWGGMALAKLLGIEKRSFSEKLFGVYSNRNLSPGRGVLGESDDLFYCAHSRHSGIHDDDLEQAADRGVVRLLSHGALTGYSVFATVDGRFLMHLGHPEYDAERLVTEWRRDSALGRTDVGPPYNFDPEAPANLWRAHGMTFFARWLTNLRCSEVVRECAAVPQVLRAHRG